MIYTVTFNPSLDYIVSVDNFELGMTNRTGSELILPGGKGINTSIVLKNLGIESTALGFVAGFTGREICRRVKDYGIIGNFIQIENGLSRINVKVKNIDGTEINGAGPEITLDKTNELYMILDRMIDGDMLILAGSIPTSMSDHTYEDILERISDKKIDIVVDATSNLLLNVLKYKPFLIKPNHHELGEIFNVTINSREEVVKYAKELHDQGAQNVIVSMGGQGAVIVAKDGSIYAADAPRGELKNSVGSGDSMVAGFVAGYLISKDYLEAFRMGVAAGSASAFSENLATEAEVKDVYKKVEINKVVNM